MKAGRSKGIRPRLPKGQPGRLTYAFVAPYFISPHDHQTLYHAGNYIFKTVNRGDSWELISPDLSQSIHKEKESTTMGAVAESPLEPGLLYAGTDKGAFWVTHDDGLEWIEHSEGLPNRYIRSICPSRFSRSRVYVAVPGINDDDLKNHLFVSEDHGKTWKSIQSNLPDEVAYVILEDPVNENILYAGLYRGVYLSTDRGQNWSLLGPDMAATAISDLVIQEREMDLVVGTHGRGIYKMNIKPIQQAFKMGQPETNILFEMPVARLPWIKDTHRDPKFSTMEKVPITFYLRKGAEVTLSVKNKEEMVIWSKQIKAKKGFNQYRWDLVREKVDSPEAYFVQYYQFARAGTYKIQISGEGIDLAGELTVIPRESPEY
jgi:photosystem II stability/assembly factor-like uncharacterized protein